MTSQIQEAVELTVGGLATVFVLLILLVVLLLLFQRLLACGPVSRLVSGPPAADPDPAQRDRALASAIGVTIALAESGRGALAESGRGRRTAEEA